MDKGFEILPNGDCPTCRQLDEHRHSLQARIVELMEENKSLAETAHDHAAQLIETMAILEAITIALKGEEPSDFMMSFPDVAWAWWVYRVAYPSS